MKILIRFDDICPTMDWEQWNRAVEILEQYRVRPLLGVIPNCQDPQLQIDPARADFWEYLKELEQKGYKLAMHGSRHVYDNRCRGLVNEGYNTEFAGHPLEVQMEKIRIGKEALRVHGIETDTFFAPSHSYDRNTLRALAANGFRYMSDGKSSKPVNRHGVICIPCRSSGCPTIRKDGYYTAVFHAHEWARSEKAGSYDRLRRLCEQYSEHIVGFEEYARRACGNPLVQSVDERCWMTAKKYYLKWRGL